LSKLAWVKIKINANFFTIYKVASLGISY